MTEAASGTVSFHTYVWRQEQRFYLSLVFFFFFLRTNNFPGGSDSKVHAYNAGDLGWIPESGISSGEGNGNPLQYSCLENPTDGGAW